MDKSPRDSKDKMIIKVGIDANKNEIYISASDKYTKPPLKGTEKSISDSYERDKQEVKGVSERVAEYKLDREQINKFLIPAQQAEKDKNYKEAIKLYEKAVEAADNGIRMTFFHAKVAIKRLMINYRKIKDYTAEIKLINTYESKAIALNKAYYEIFIKRYPEDIDTITKQYNKHNYLSIGYDSLPQFNPYKYNDRLIRAKELLSKHGNNG